MEFVPEYSLPERPEGKGKAMLVVPLGGADGKSRALGRQRAGVGMPPGSLKRA